MSSSTPLAQRNRRLRRILQAALFLFLLSGVLVYAAWEWRAFYKQGRLTAPPPGTEGALTPEEAAHLEKVVQGLNARVVWSSNRAGTHDLWMLELPARTLSRLTRDEFTDTFPRFSPDGKQLLFMRSQQPWISQRNGVEWDTWNLDLQSGVETRVATNATMAVWHPDGERIFFTRNNSQVVEKRLADGVETIRLESGKGSMPEGVALPNVSVREGDPWLALTLRGKIRATAVVNQQGEWTKVGDGCQIFWHPGGSGAIYVDGPGMMKNAIYSLSEPGWERTLLLDAPEPFSHEYFPWLSDDGQYLVYGASAGGHEHDVADYEIFLWRVGDPPENVVRLTAHSGNDNWPDIHIP